MGTFAKKLLVEGATDQRVIPYLMEHHGIDWPKARPPVFIKEGGRIDELKKPGFIGLELQASGLEALGIVLDADKDASARWIELKTSLVREFAALPDQVFAALPDNRSGGMLEDLLAGLIPEDSSALHELAQTCAGRAKSIGAPFRDVHERKAEIYTWLAWQDPPGLQLHDAVKHRVLDPKRPESSHFVAWFRHLFHV